MARNKIPAKTECSLENLWTQRPGRLGPGSQKLEIGARADGARLSEMHEHRARVKWCVLRVCEMSVNTTRPPLLRPVDRIDLNRKFGVPQKDATRFPGI